MAHSEFRPSFIALRGLARSELEMTNSRWRGFEGRVVRTLLVSGSSLFTKLVILDHLVQKGGGNPPKSMFWGFPPPLSMFCVFDPRRELISPMSSVPANTLGTLSEVLLSLSCHHLSDLVTRDTLIFHLCAHMWHTVNFVPLLSLSVA